MPFAVACGLFLCAFFLGGGGGEGRWDGGLRILLYCQNILSILYPYHCQ